MLQTVADILRRRQTEGWLVGGSVRDGELGRYSPDLDIAVADDAVEVARELATALRCPWFALSERHLAYRVMGPDGRVDVATLRGGSILEDLGARDFTVNAMASPIGGGALVDPFGGAVHLREGRLVAVSDRIFAADPLRLMRAARFRHVLGLELDAGLTRAVHDQAQLLTQTAPERVFSEIVLTLGQGRTAEAVESWLSLGLLDVVLPELAGTGSMSFTLALLARLDDLLEKPHVWFAAAADPLSERLAQPVDGAVSRAVALPLAGMLHRLSPDAALAAGRRLRLSREMISLLRTVAAHFSNDGALPVPLGTDRRPSPQLTPCWRAPGRAAVLFLWEAAPWEPEVIVLEAARPGDPAEGTGTLPGSGPALERARAMMALWAQRAVNGVPRSLVDGEILMRELGLDSGPLLGRLLREVRLAWEAGDSTTREELLGVARGALRTD